MRSFFEKYLLGYGLFISHIVKDFKFYSVQSRKSDTVGTEAKPDIYKHIKTNILHP